MFVKLVLVVGEGNAFLLVKVLHRHITANLLI